MSRLLIPLLLFALFSLSDTRPKFDDDENLFESLNKTMLEISQTPVKELSLDEISAAFGTHITQEHRDAAEELLSYREDRPLGALIADLQTFGTYTKPMAEEFSRGAMRALLDKSYMLPESKKLKVGDFVCRCNLRECAAVNNELYAVMGPQMTSFCRVDKYGHCMTSTTVINNTSTIQLYCAPSNATPEQIAHHEKNPDQEHNHICKSTKVYGKSCCRGAMCNDIPLPITDPLNTELEEQVKELEESLSLWKGLGMSLIVILFFVSALLIFLFLLLCKFVDVEELKKRICDASSIPTKRLDENSSRVTSRYFNNNERDERGSNAGSESPLIPPSLQTFSEGGTTNGGNSSNPTRSYLDIETTVGCGTGAGGNIVAQRTLSSSIRITQTLGQGKFGKVFLGVWRGGEKIAVKKFDHVLYDSFEQEVEILMSGMMSNSNILRWIGKDTVDTGSSTEFWIMSEYHPNGSLYDYMEKNALSQRTFLLMMRGISNGISFLHSEIPAIEGTTGKKGVAHRDLKTKNILVKSDLTCVIADFGMAVINEQTGVKLPPGTKKSGTVRYLAPEVLVDDICHVSEFEYYRASDMYSFALIMWECARRTHAVFGKTAIAEYSMDESLAYYTDVPREPSIADMREVVVVKELRPPIDEMWIKNPVFFEMSRIMRECWSTNSTARLAALNVKIVIDRLSSELNLNLPTGYD